MPEFAVNRGALAGPRTLTLFSPKQEHFPTCLHCHGRTQHLPYPQVTAARARGERRAFVLDESLEAGLSIVGQDKLVASTEEKQAPADVPIGAFASSNSRICNKYVEQRAGLRHFLARSLNV